ncbi:hypothetical protein DSM104443_04292 [Usitatibacter rugosus]|uniref:Uncharacterized protein n=1 Tax=Usitatibacter rugosus TaxID=2732067 RepID=A0A6M4H5K4_9PROT|nr:hypothetical protein [Usitatibacter rugosus]QJR13197.1 hypothetical protein DSM104443_04292 [Usitatibacter rugosus]
MMEDPFRKDHDPTPGPDERDWLRGNFYHLLGRATLMIGYAIVIGVGTSVILDRQGALPAMAAAEAPAPIPASPPR